MEADSEPLAAARKKAEAAGKPSASKIVGASLEELEKKNKLLERNRKLECRSSCPSMVIIARRANSVVFVFVSRREKESRSR